MKKVCFIPAHSSNNKYVELVRKSITQAGFELSLKNSFSEVLHCDIVHFNWYEGIPAGSMLLKWRYYTQKMLVLRILKLLGKKIIFTMHNKMPHEQENTYYSNRILTWLLNNSDIIVIHCKESYKIIADIVPDVDKASIMFIPHPNYISIYPDNIPYNNYIKSSDEVVLLFLGQVRPYKNVEIIIQAANTLKNYEKIKFLICGKCSSEDYRNQLQLMVEGSNVFCDFRFIEDEEIPSLMQLADALILPYNTKTSLNSGAAYLAFSYGRSVVSTDIGTVKDLAQSGLVYCYEFSETEEEHVAHLVKAILELYKDYLFDPNIVQTHGKMLLQMMEQQNSIADVARFLTKAYS